MVQHRTLEEIVLDVTGSGSDQFGVPAPVAGVPPATSADAQPVTRAGDAAS
jgi:hypothetical protein